MSTSEVIVNFLKSKGPSLPVHIAKQINTNLFMASVHLAELTSNGKAKVSSLKVGGSPSYFLPGQEPLLESFSDNLQEKEKKSF